MPSSNARLPLKQLGLSVAQIQDAIHTFRRQVGDSGEPSDQAFMRFARQTTDAPALERRLAEVLGIELDWQPSSQDLQRLEGAGYHPAAIEHYRTVFVISAREQGRALRDPGRAFVAFCHCRATTLPAPLPAEWLPRVETLQRLVQTQGLDADRIPALLERFVLAYQDRMSSDWDGTFTGWVKRHHPEGRADARVDGRTNGRTGGG